MSDAPPTSARTFPAHDGARPPARRRLLQALGASGACALANGLPATWQHPLIDAVVLPAHAQTTAAGGRFGPACGPVELADRIPDVFRGTDFTQACLNHDACYSPSASVSRVECDLRFLQDLLAACSQGTGTDGSCERVAYTYFRTVRRLGAPYFIAGRTGRR